MSNRVLIAGYALALSLMMSLTMAAAGMASVDDHAEAARADETRVTAYSTEIDAPVAAVWRAFTTSEGYQGWAAPFAIVDLRVGGQIEASYAADPVAGAPDNILIEIQAFLPERLLVLKTVRAPAAVASQETLDRLVSIFEFDPLGETRTRVTVHGVGYTEEDEAMRLAFEQSNPWVLGRLADYLSADAAAE